MASGYPAALDTFATNKQDDIDAKSGVDLGLTTTIGDHPQHHNDLADAINKMQAEFGIQPRGLYAATVRERFEISAYKNQSVSAATTAALPTANYANGTAGVGATLTATANAALAAQDGITLVLGSRILVKNQAAPAQNGIYTVTQVGSGSLPFILTRAIDADTAAKIADCRILVDQGTTQGDTEWGCTATAPTIGTTALPWKRTSPIYGHGNPRFPWDIAAPTTQVIMATVPRVLVLGTYTVVLTTATQYLIGGIVVPAGRTVSNVNFMATTAGAAPSVSWFALARQSDRLVLGHTANILTAPTAGAVTTRALVASWTPSEDTPVWLVMSYAVATTAMVLAASPAGTAAVNLIAPAMAATNGVVPTTTVPTDGTTVITAATAGITNVPLFWLT